MWLEMDSSVFTDFYWKLDSSPYASSTYVVVRLSFQGGYEVNYVLANVGGSYSNSSWQATYYASGLNQTGVWNRLYRNLTLDFTSVFGTPVSSWNLTQCVLDAYGGSSGGKIQSCSTT